MSFPFAESVVIRPKMTVYNAVSLDGRVTGFDVDMDLYYGISAQWGNDGVLVGSRTVLQSMKEIPPETEEDMVPPGTEKDSSLPYVIFVDSKGMIRSHHVFRQQPFIREVLVLISRASPDEYRKYLDERKIQYIETGEDRVDLKEAMEVLHDRYGLGNMRSDSGGGLNSALMHQGLVDNLIVLMEPYLAGGDEVPFFNELKERVGPMDLKKIEKLDNGRFLIEYEVPEQTDHHEVS